MKIKVSQFNHLRLLERYERNFLTSLYIVGYELNHICSFDTFLRLKKIGDLFCKKTLKHLHQKKGWSIYYFDHMKIDKYSQYH